MEYDFEGYLTTGSWPIRVNVAADYDEDSGDLMLDTDEARALVARLNALIQDYESRNMVQVRLEGAGLLGGSPGLYTYADPSGRLKTGDVVIVPVGPNGTEKRGVVAALGRGDFDGKIKEVTAVLQRKDL